MTDAKADVKSVENSTTANVLISNDSNYHRTEVFVRIEQTEARTYCYILLTCHICHFCTHRTIVTVTITPVADCLQPLNPE